LITKFKCFAKDASIFHLKLGVGSHRLSSF
jgi:hypothetical protein